MVESKVILVTTSSFCVHESGPLDLLRSKGYEVVVNPYNRKLIKEELVELLDKYKPVGLLAGTEPIARDVLEKSQEYLKVISRIGVGWDNIDHQAVQELGMQVFRTPGVLNQAVAELTIGMMLSSVRMIASQDRAIRSGVWEKRMGGLLGSKTVGIIGFGAIGQRVGELIRAFGSRVVYFDPCPVEKSWAESLGFEKLLVESDIITLHACGDCVILGENELKLLAKDGAVIVNVARGGMIDEEALYQYLIDGRISSACLDVFSQEPYTGPLAQLDNVLLTPHIGSYATEARVEMELKASENVIHRLCGTVSSCNES